MTKKLSSHTDAFSIQIWSRDVRRFRTSQNVLVQGEKFNTAFSMASPILRLTDCCITIALSNLKYGLRL